VIKNLERQFFHGQEAQFEAELEEAARLLEGIDGQASKSYGVLAPFLVSEVALEHALDAAAENLEFSQGGEAELSTRMGGGSKRGVMRVAQRGARGEGVEKADSRRRPPRRRPKGWIGSWPKKDWAGYGTSVPGAPPASLGRSLRAKSDRMNLFVVSMLNCIILAIKTEAARDTLMTVNPLRRKSLRAMAAFGGG
jgi:hypothetical protein